MSTIFSCLTGLLTARHPTLGILCRSDGAVYNPGDKWHKPKWTYGCRMRNGYMTVCVQGRKNLLVHRLIAETFVANPDNRPEVDHSNRDRSDNRMENLRWATRSENQRNTVRNDRAKDRLGLNSFEDSREYNRRNCKDWYERNKDQINAKRRIAA